MLPNSPLWDQGAATGGVDVGKSVITLVCPPGRSRVLRAACRPCSRGPAVRVMIIAKDARRWWLMARLTYVGTVRSGGHYALPMGLEWQLGPRDMTRSSPTAMPWTVSSRQRCRAGWSDSPNPAVPVMLPSGSRHGSAEPSDHPAPPDLRRYSAIWQPP